MLVGNLEVRVLAQQLAALEIGMHRAALDRPGPHERDLDDEVVERLRPGAGQHLHLRPALDLEDAGRLRRPDRLEGLGVVERDPREVDPLAARARDLLDAALDRRQHPQPEQVDLQKARVRAGVLVPLDDLAALHRCRLDRAEVDQRPGREHHPAGVLGEVARQPLGLAREPGQARQRGDAARAAADRLGDRRARPRRRRVHVGDPATRSISRLRQARAPCRGRGPRRASGRWRRRRPAPRARAP